MSTNQIVTETENKVNTAVSHSQANTTVPYNQTNTTVPYNQANTLDSVVNETITNSDIELKFNTSDNIMYILSIIVLIIYISFSVYALVMDNDGNTLLQAKQFLITFIVFSFLNLEKTILNFLKKNPISSIKKTSYDKILDSFGLALFIWNCILLFKEIGFEHCWEKYTYKIITIYFFNNIFIFAFLIIFFIVFMSCLCCCNSCLGYCLKTMTISNTPTIAVAMPMFGDIRINATILETDELSTTSAVNIPTAEVVSTTPIKVVDADIENQIIF